MFALFMHFLCFAVSSELALAYIITLDKDSLQLLSQKLPCTKPHILGAFPVLILGTSDLRAEDCGANSGGSMA